MHPLGAARRLPEAPPTLSSQVAIAESVPPLPLKREASATRRQRLDWFDLVVLAVFVIVSVWVIALDLIQVSIHGGHFWTGADSLWGVDQFQYQSWVRAASQHGLVSNLYVLRSTPADYFQPAILISGGLTALGVPPWLSLLLWKPIAVAAVFVSLRAYVNRTLPERRARAAALVLALFFGSWTIVYGSIGPIGDMFPGFLTWGYPFGLLGLAGMVGSLLAYDRARSSERMSWMPGILGAAASSVHPWNGAMLIAAIVGAELAMVRWRRMTRAQLRLPAVTLALSALPLIYYVVLGRTDPSWHLAQQASKHSFPLWSVALELTPLAVPALLAYRKYPRTFLGAATLVWPVAALAEYIASTTSFGATPLHAVQGITLPLAILAVVGLRDIGFNRLRYSLVIGALLVLMFTVPMTFKEMRLARRMTVFRVDDNNYITTSEHRALDFLANDPHPGGVVTRVYLGELVPGMTGRRTYVGDCLWSQPACHAREGNVLSLFQGPTTPAAARRFVAYLVSQNSRFLLRDCQSKADLDKLIAPLIVSVHRFGCAAVYEVD